MEAQAAHILQLSLFRDLKDDGWRRIAEESIRDRGATFFVSAQGRSHGRRSPMPTEKFRNSRGPIGTWGKGRPQTRPAPAARAKKNYKKKIKKIQGICSTAKDRLEGGVRPFAGRRVRSAPAAGFDRPRSGQTRIGMTSLRHSLGGWRLLTFGGVIDEGFYTQASFARGLDAAGTIGPRPPSGPGARPCPETIELITATPKAGPKADGPDNRLETRAGRSITADVYQTALGSNEHGR